MLEIILKCISAILQIFLTIYSIFIVTEKMESIKYTKSKKIISSILFSTFALISAYLPNGTQNLKILLCSVPTFIILRFILKTSLLKSILFTISIFIFFAITELISVIIISALFNYPADEFNSNIKVLLSMLALQMLIILILIKTAIYILNKFQKNSKVSENFKSDKTLNILIILLTCILPKILLTGSNSYGYSIPFLIINVLENIVMIILTFIFFKRTLERDKAQSELNLSEMHNKTMVGMVDGVRTLKHDYNNIIQALSGYVKTKQYDKLEEHINKVLQECNVVNNFSMITPETFNEPAVYGIMGAKYFIAVDKEITVDLDVSCDFTKISFPMPEFSRVLGILLDNAIEATQKSSKKYIRFEAKYDSRKNADIIKVINTYDTNINIDLNKIYEKGFSSKKVKSGIGLWEVKKLIKKNKNSQIYASIENNKFVQNLIIERLSDYQNFKTINIVENTQQNMLMPLNK